MTSTLICRLLSASVTYLLKSAKVKVFSTTRLLVLVQNRKSILPYRYIHCILNVFRSGKRARTLSESDENGKIFVLDDTPQKNGV